MRWLAHRRHGKYISSYSHGGKYYSLMRIARFNKSGLWFPGSACFSRSGTLLDTIVDLVGDSEKGYSVTELDDILKVKVANSLLNLLEKRQLDRDKWGGVYIYYSTHPELKKKQELNRRESLDRYTALREPAMLMNELKASLVTFFSLLGEQQRRVFLGLESLKHGYGGDRLIAEIFGVTEKTVARGRTELLEDRVLYDSTRKKGGGRTPLEMF